MRNTTRDVDLDRRPPQPYLHNKRKSLTPQSPSILPREAHFVFFLVTQTSVHLPFGEHGELGTQEDSPANSENCWVKTRRQERKKGTTDQSDNKDCSRGPQQNSSRNPRSSEVELWWPWLMFWFPGRPTRRSLHYADNIKGTPPGSGRTSKQNWNCLDLGTK